MEGIMNKIQLPLANQSIIKVVGVGGGGGNAVNHMFQQGIKDVSFVICNTDDQALNRSLVPNKIHLGKNVTQGLGAGNKPEVARNAALESIEEIETLFKDGTKMAFITAGMGGGTGTGAAPVVAEVAQKLNILTVGIVTIPFKFEGKRKIHQALKGVAEMSKYVDALLVIHNDKLRNIYPELDLNNAFAKADDVLTSAAKGIAEIITIDGPINVDFADVNTIMRNGGVAVMNTGYAEGERRLTKAIESALNSPLLNNNNIHDSKKILLNIYSSTTNPVKMSEIDEIHEFMAEMGDDVEVIWGTSFEETLGEQVKITLIATGANMSMVPPEFIEQMEIVEKTSDAESAVKDVYKNPIWEDNQKDPLGEWTSSLYPDMKKEEELQFKLNLDEIDEDDQLLHKLELEPTYKRCIKK